MRGQSAQDAHRTHAGGGGRAGVRVLAAMGLLALGLIRVLGHSLPISYLLLVSAEEYIHLELTFNPFELAQFAEADTNHNGRLDAGELEASDQRLTRAVLECLTLRVAGQDVHAETAGLRADPDTHHLTLRAHYRVEPGADRITIESRLPGTLGAAHLTQVKWVRGAEVAFAQLDARSPVATFPAEEPGVRPKRSRRSNSTSKPNS